MVAYPKLEESIIDTDTSLKQDLMVISLLALLVSPWAALGLVVSKLGITTMISSEVTLVCVLVLLAAAPKLLQLMFPHQGHWQQANHTA